MENKEFTKNEFKVLFDNHFVAVRNFIYYQSGDIQLAEDIVQEAYIKLWEMRNNIKPETVKALLYKIADNMLKNNFKHRKAQLKFETLAKPEFKTSENPQFLLEHQEFEYAYHHIINNMNGNDRVVFLMNRIDELTYADIAARLNLSVKAVEKRMHNALQYLRLHLKFKI